MDTELSLAGKAAIITGAARGIGKEIARTFVRHGARVAVVDILEKEGAQTVRELGAETVFFRCDIANPDLVRSTMESALERFGRLDILVNNAAYLPAKAEERVPSDTYPDGVFSYAIDVDINGTFYCSKYAAQKMIPRGGGSIINIASVAGVVPLRNQLGHVVGKAGVIRLTEAMALELGPRGVRVNAISPGSTATEGTRGLFYNPDATYSEKGERLLSFIPAGRPAEPQDIANAALFLASGLASYVNGHNFVVDGGWTCGFTRDF